MTDRATGFRQVAADCAAARSSHDAAKVAAFYASDGSISVDVGPATGGREAIARSLSPRGP